MQRLTALVTWPSAPLTDSLVRKALSSIHPPPSIVTSLSENQVSSPENLLQWSTYDFIDHDLTHSTSSSSNVLSSSYTIRKALIRKHFLSRCIHNYLTKNPNSPLTNAAPQTWEIELSFADELDEMWGDDLFGLARELEDNTSKWWMLKPGMADRGMGIRLFHTKEGLERIFQEFEQDDSEEEVEEGNQNQRGPTTAVVTSQLRHFVIQEYLSKPLLLDPSEVALDGQPKPLALHGYKFHLRVYCVASGALTVYLYTRILALFSAVPYSAPRVPAKDLSDVHAVNENLAAHLTNTSLQTERGEAGVRLLDELVGCHVLSGPSPNVPPSRTQQPRPPQALGQTLDVERIQAARKEQKENAQEARTSQQNESIFSAEDVDDLKTQIAVVLSETFKAALEMSVHFQVRYELRTRFS
ncbi:hypothetical protein AcW2_000999 [Taiwanofungus camphoratus]|nr:hypothetical protein AcW2_000999 [Antrodia cinnamomea]